MDKNYTEINTEHPDREILSELYGERVSFSCKVTSGVWNNRRYLQAIKLWLPDKIHGLHHLWVENYRRSWHTFSHFNKFEGQFVNCVGEVGKYINKDGVERHCIKNIQVLGKISKKEFYQKFQTKSKKRI